MKQENLKNKKIDVGGKDDARGDDKLVFFFWALIVLCTPVGNSLNLKHALTFVSDFYPNPLKNAKISGIFSVLLSFYIFQKLYFFSAVVLLTKLFCDHCEL